MGQWICRCVFGVALVLLASSAWGDDANPRTIYFSTGDNQDLLGLPLDSQATIEAVMGAIHRSYQAQRVWWRGGQDEIWGREFAIRPENRSSARLWEWWKDLSYRKVKTNAIAVKAAHAHGMQIWMAYGLLDAGAGADVGYAGFPFPAEDRLRLEHPEWAPVNRFGTWRQGGPIEFCYPEARKAVARRLTRYIVQGGYDGIALLTYAENFSQRYEDEFGFNAPIVEEFRRRHGVDIRTAAFDKQAWAKLRGEYLTAFLREFHAALAAQGKKLALCVDGQEPHFPSQWHINGGVRTAGRIYLDLETWVKEGLVDELNVYAPASEEAIAHCTKLCAGGRTTCSVFRTRGSMPAGAPRIMFVGTDVESGFDWEHFIDYPDEKVPPQPPGVLDGTDALAKRRLLTAVAKGKQTLPLEKLTAATKDPDVLVRRAALRALGAVGDRAARTAVEACLADPENAVRCQAALVLAQLPGEGTVQALLAAADREDASYQFSYRAIPEALKLLQAKQRLSTAERQWIVTQAGGAEAKRREVALAALVLVGAPATGATQAAMLRILTDDPSPACREMAIVNLRSSFGPVPEVAAALRAALHEKDPVVQLRAAGALASMVPSMVQVADRQQVLSDVAGFFKQYGEGCRRSDADWGWRELGNAICAAGPPGEEMLREMMASKTDPRLAEIAWRVLYLKQGDAFQKVTAEQDLAAHALRPGTPGR